jgi:16S rRNA (uracil1498-N3)-methyltransferase
MLQSQQCWLPTLHEPISFDQGVINATHQQKFIAHCIEDEKKNLSDFNYEFMPDRIILIGPPGDFTPGEVKLAIQHHFEPVSLGKTRLRTETAGVVAAAMLVQ